MIFVQILINAVMVQVPTSEIHFSGNATYQDLKLRYFHNSPNLLNRCIIAIRSRNLPRSRSNILRVLVTSLIGFSLNGGWTSPNLIQELTEEFS